jgi:predicted RNase H-like nuclease (RuvC/YqgF family)
LFINASSDIQRLNLQIRDLNAQLEALSQANQEKARVSLNCCCLSHSSAKVQQQNRQLTIEMSDLKIEVESLRRKLEESRRDKEALQQKLDAAFLENKQLFGRPVTLRVSI